MFQDIFNIILIFFISLIPIVIWAYIFSYVDDSKINKKRFLFWIIWWWLSVIPILYMDKIFSVLNLDFFNFFLSLKLIKSFFTSFIFSISLNIFIIFIAFFSLILWFFLRKNFNILKIYLKNILTFFILVFILWFFIYLLNISFSGIDYFNNYLSNDKIISYWDIFFNTVKLIIFYYLVIAFIEEASKHFNFIGSSILDIKKVSDGVLYAIFVALWFSFIENILYFYNFFIQNWFNYELVKLYFFRSIFSVIVHILSSSIVAYWFSKAILEYRKTNFNFSYLKIFLSSLLIWIFIHFLFDFSLTLGFNFIIILYFVFGYLYVSSIFYRE